MERPIFKPVGTPATELDTPALVVDLAALEHNLTMAHSFFRDRTAKVRPHVTMHRCPALAHQQLAAGGTVDGVYVSTLSEAEIFAEQGFTDLFLANTIVTAPKLRRLCALARHATLTVAVDAPAHVRSLAEAAGAHGVTLRVVVNIHTRQNGCGVKPGQPALDLARTVHATPHLTFAGLMTSEGPILTADPEARAAETRQCLQPLLETRARIEQAGIAVSLVSAGNTSNYEVVGDMDGITEVPLGTYALLDARYSQYCPQLRPAARILTTVTSRPQADTAITDAGQKAVSVDRGLPVAAQLPGATVTSLSAEHCRLHLHENTTGALPLGAKLWLIPQDIGTCVNLYDYIHAVRDDRLEAVWRVAARGQYR